MHSNLCKAAARPFAAVKRRYRVARSAAARSLVPSLLLLPLLLLLLLLSLLLLGLWWQVHDKARRARMLSRSTDTSTAIFILELLPLLLLGVVVMMVVEDEEEDKERRALISAPNPCKIARSSPVSRSRALRGGFSSV